MKHFKSFCLVLVCLLGVGVIGTVVGVPIVAHHKGYKNVFDYVQTWPVFDNDKEKTVEDEIVDDTLNDAEDETTAEDETQTSEDETVTQGE